jgi:alpha-N-arabinofuranosidase
MAGAEPMLAVNLGTRGAAEARDLVEYCNHPGGTALSDLRAKHGWPKPHGVKLWCLGNEMDGTWQIGHKTPLEYARAACEAAKLMKWTDPSIELVACGSSYHGMPTFGEWEETVLEHCWDHVDYISLHSYFSFRGDTSEFLASPLKFEAFIDEVVGICDRVRDRKKNRKTMMLSFDEWNVWYRASSDKPQGWPRAPRQGEEVYDFQDALVVGGLLISLINRCDRVKIACLAQLVNAIAPIMTSERGAWRQTIFWPFLHASLLGRGTALRVGVDAPFYATPKFPEVPSLAAAAVANDGAGTLTLFLLNRDLEETLEISCDVRPWTGARVQRQIVLDHDDLKAVNGEDTPERVVPREGRFATLDAGRLTMALAPHSWNVVTIR